jgi:hypothetical protein
MSIVGQNIGETFPAHGLHGDTIQEAITFVWTGSVQFEARKEEFTALWDHPDGWVFQNILDVNCGLPPQVFRCAGEKGELLAQDFVGSDNVVRHLLGPLIGGISRKA